MDREIIREESEEPGRCITANKLLCKLGEESNYTGHVEDWNLHKQKVVLKVGTMIDKKTTSKANSNSQLANAQASKQKQPIEMDAKQKRNYALKNFEYDSSSFLLSSLSKGRRMRQWVAEIREPKKRSRIRLVSYSSPVAAARAYDTAVFYRRGPSARLNFPKLFAGGAMSAASIRKKATEVGAQVDAVETALHHPHPHHQHQHQQQQQHRSSTAKMEFKTTCGRFVDLNKVPDPENSDPSGRGTRLKRKTS